MMKFAMALLMGSYLLVVSAPADAAVTTRTRVSTPGSAKPTTTTPGVTSPRVLPSGS